jgi:hypothetical protein
MSFLTPEVKARHAERASRMGLSLDGFYEYFEILDVVENLREYVLHRVPKGDFLTAVLENDLQKAMYHADLNNR